MGNKFCVVKCYWKAIARKSRYIGFNVGILILVVAFFAMSINLYQNSQSNLLQVEDTYSTIAIMELYGDINKYGELVEPGSENHIGYQSVSVFDFDLSEIVTATGVKTYDLRAKYAAYIENNPAKKPENGSNEIADKTTICYEDIIKFTLVGDEPFLIPISWNKSQQNANTPYGLNGLYLNVSDSAAGCYWYNKQHFNYSSISAGFTTEDKNFYAKQVKQLNRSDELDYVILYPDVEYVATTRLPSGWKTTEDSNGFMIGMQRFYPSSLNYFGEDYYVSYQEGGIDEVIDSTNYMEANAPFPIARWDDVQSDPNLKKLWEGAWDAMKYNICAYTVCLTDDISGVPVFHVGSGFLSDGRMITETEYTTGSKVCMISKELAQMQGWYVGQKLEMSFFMFDAFPNSNTILWGDSPVYHKNTDGFFYEDEYEIVGIFDQKPIVGNSGIAKSTLTMPWNTIYIPHNAVDNTLPEAELPVHGALLTIWLGNGSINDFLADMDTLGLTEPKEGQYNPKFSFYDQGYSVIQPSLQSMHSTAKLLIILSALLFVITCVLLAYFFAQNQKHNIGIFRMLGGKKTQAIWAVLICSTLIAVIGAILGTMVGHILSEQVGEIILTGNLEENEKTAALRAYVLATEEIDTSAFDVHSSFKLSVLAGSAALLFPLLSFAFVVLYIGKEPRELLPKNKA